jgi:hypothetical protein
MKELELKIKQLELEIELDKAYLQMHHLQLKQQIATPECLGMAALAGFLFTYTTLPKTRKSQTTKSKAPLLPRLLKAYQKAQWITPFIRTFSR